MHRIFSPFVVMALLVAADCIAQAQGAADEVLAENALVKLTRADYETDLLRVPPDMRSEFAASPTRLTMMLNTLLIDKTLAQEARNAGLDRDPEIARRLALETDRFYAQAMLGKVERDAAAEFESKSEGFLAKAREVYALNKSKYMLPEQVSVSHILFAAKRGDSAALALAEEARARLVAGADFAELARQLSDDPSAKRNGGQLGWLGGGQTDAAVVKAAFELKNTGDLSEPVHSRLGWHIIRLDGRRPGREQSFEEAQKKIMNDLKQRYIQDARRAKLEAINKDPNMKVNQAAIDALVVKLPEIPRVPPAPAIN